MEGHGLDPRPSLNLSVYDEPLALLAKLSDITLFHVSHS
jgi:hypothetical protein